MAYLSITSNNPKFTYLLGKNPSTGILAKELREGLLFGWYQNNTYHVFFKDSEIDISFKSSKYSEFEFINASQYNSPLFLLGAIKEYFHSTMNGQFQDDEKGFANRCQFIVDCNSRQVELFNNSFQDYMFSSEPISKWSRRVTILTEEPLFALLRMMGIFALYLAYQKPDVYIDKQSDQVEKYLKYLIDLDPPYAIRNVFKLAVLSVPQLRAYLPMLEVSKRYSSIKLTPYNTQVMRKTHIVEHMTSQEWKGDILDMGCGECFYLPEIMKHFSGHYIGIDIDNQALHRARNKIHKYNLDAARITLANNLEGIIINPSHILLFELLEHLEINDARKLIFQMLSYHPLSIVITTPNRGFNKHYGLKEGELRHPEHKFEWDMVEFWEFLGRIRVGFEVSGLGDEIDGEHSILVAKYAGK